MMFSRSKAWAIALLAAMFVAGGAAGWAASLWWRSGPRTGRGPVRMADYLAKRLDLDSAQRDSVRTLLVRHNTEMQGIWATVRPRFDSLRGVVHQEIDALLTPAQHERHAQLLHELEHQHDQRGRRDTTLPNPRQH
jgi:hypothetical protein